MQSTPIAINQGASPTRSTPRPAAWRFKSWFVLAPIGFATLLLLVDPLLRIPLRFELNYNEGWNLYHSAEVLAGQSPYANSGGLAPTNYLPGYFFLLGLIGKLLGDPLLVGRSLSFLALLLVSVGVGVALIRLGCSRLAAAVGCLACLALFATRAREYVGMNDPQLLGHVFTFGSLLLYLRSDGSRRTLLGIAALAIVGLSLKHSLIVVPITLVLDALLRSRRLGLRLGAYLGVLGGALLLSVYLLYGAESLEQIFGSRVVSPARLVQPEIRWHALWTSVAVGTASVGLILSRGNHRRTVGLYLLVALFTGLVGLSGSGTNVNMLFGSFLALSLANGVIMDSLLRELSARLRPSTSLLVRLLAPLVLVGAIITEFPHIRLWERDLHLAREAQFARDATFLASQPGPALCESLLLCYFAGKELEYDPFLVGQLLATKTLPEQVVLSKLEQRYFLTVQLIGEVHASCDAESLWRRERFSQSWKRQLFQHFEMVQSSDLATFFLARDEARP
jgi:hypothetical protein